LELTDDTRDDGNAAVAHDGRTASGQYDAIKAVSVPESGSAIEPDIRGPGVQIDRYSGQFGILGHGQASQNGLNRS
jgi:hypothetical protein